MLKKVFSVLLVTALLIGMLPYGVASTVSNAASKLADGTVIYYEDFNYADNTNKKQVLSTLGWELAEEFRTNNVSYSISGGKLLCDTTGSSSTSDSYVTVLDNDAMSEAAKGDYTISYKLKYAAATDYTKYSCLIYNYNGYKSYNTVHLRVAGYGNNQVRAYSWYSLDDSASSYYMPATGTSSISYKLYGVKAASANASSNTDYPMVGKEVTIRIAVDIDKGATVYINGTKVSVPVTKYKELFLSTQQYASAIALKTTAKIKAYMDDFMVYTGLGDIPTGVTKDSVTYQPPKGNDYGDTLKVMSFNTLFENQATAALSDGLNRTTHMYNVVAGYHPDIVGMQERSAANKSGVTSMLASDAGYAVVDEYRTDTSVSSVLTLVPIMYNKNRLTLQSNTSSNNNMGHGALLFKKSYNIIGMTAAQKAAYSGTKGMSWAVFKDKQSGSYILAMNTHFALALDTYTNYTAEDAVEARLSNAEECFGVMDKVFAVYGNIPVVFTGDYNMRSYDPSYKYILTKLSDTIYANDSFIRYEYSMNSITDPSFTRAPNMPIDHIFYSSESLTAIDYEVGNGSGELRIASDHLPVIATYAINKAVAPLCSHSTGIYEGTQAVTLEGNGAIYYTTDNSDPISSDTRKLYGGVIPVAEDTVIKYCAYQNGVYSNVERVTLYFGNPIYITEVCKNTVGTDFYEGIEIINVSSVPLDLYDFIIWSYSDASDSVCSSVKAADVSSQMKMSRVEGLYVVPAGGVAFCPTANTAMYKNKEKISAEESTYLITVNNDCTEVTYHTDKWANAIAYDGSGNISPDLIFPIDRTARSIGYTENGTLVKRFDYYNTTADEVNNTSKSFNMSNSAYTKLYITFNTAQYVSEAVTSCYLDGTNGGTTTAADGTTTVAEGSYHFLPSGKTLMKTATFTKKAYSIGYLEADQQSAFGEMMAKRSKTASTPIGTAAEFAAMSANGSYYLTANISIDTSHAAKFTGTLDGRGHTVITSVPLFTDISGTVKNLAVKGEVNGKGGNIGAIAATSSGGAWFENVTVNAKIYGGTATGGLVGYLKDGANVTAKNCANYGSIEGSSHTGGLFGYVQGKDLTMDGCVNKGRIHSNAHSGGMIGRFGIETATTSYICSIINCVNYGEITAAGTRAAGIIAAAVGILRIGGCDNYGYIHYTNASTNFMSGGIYGAGIANYKDSTGAEIQTVTALYIKDCHNYANVVATTNAGGIAGRLPNHNAADGYNYIISDCGNMGNITTYDAGSTYTTKGAGGIAGYFSGGSQGNGIFRCYNLGTITVNGGTNGVIQRASGITAYFSGTKTYFKDCYNAGTVTAVGADTAAYQLFFNNNTTGGDTTYITNNHALAVSGATYCVNGTQADSFSTFTAAQLSGGTVKTNLNKGIGTDCYYQPTGFTYPVLKEWSNIHKNHIQLKSTSNYSEDGSYITNVTANTKADVFAAHFDTDIKLFKGAALYESNVPVATGTKLSSFDGSVFMTVIVNGDIDCNGMLSATDYINLKEHLKTGIALNKAQTLAADTDSNGGLSAADYVSLKMMLAES